MTESRQLWKTIKQELLRVQDIEAVVLKGHLLVESQVNVALACRLGPEIEEARLGFQQKLHVLACVWPALKEDGSSMGPRSPYENWRELNALRNKIAHQLSPLHLRTLLIEWVTKTLGYRLKTINRTVVLRRNIVKAVILDVAMLSGFIKGWRSASR